MKEWWRKLAAGVILFSLAEAGAIGAISKRSDCDAVYFRVRQWGYWYYPKTGQKAEASIVFCIRDGSESSVYTRTEKELRINGSPFWYQERQGFFLVSYTHSEESGVFATTAIFDSEGNLWDDSEIANSFAVWDFGR